MKVSFETPIEMLADSTAYNDFDYALVHLFKFPEYLRYYEEAIKSGRTVVLDNSAFELGVSFNVSEFVFWVKYLEKMAKDPKNLIAVVPDKLHDTAASLELAKEFCESFKTNRLECRKMFVIQGNDYSKRLYCAKMMEHHLERDDLFAVNMTPTDYSGSTVVTPEEKEGHRYEMLSKLVQWQDDGFLKKVNFHLLGCHCPQAMQIYKDAPFKDRLESFDTSAPVILGYEGKRINQIHDKSNLLFDQMVTSKLTAEQISLIRKNAEYFKGNILGDSKENPFSQS